MKITLSAVFILALSSAATVSASGVITLPIRSLRIPSNLNAASLTRRYLHTRAIGASTAVPLTNVENDICYTIPMQLGTPAQEFNVLIDTGSPITWVSSSTCNSIICSQVNTFDCSKSATCNSTINTFNVSYVSGQSVVGQYAIEMYKIGSMKFKGVAGIVTENKAELPPTVDGIMGLWYVPQIAQVPILNVLKTYNVLSQNVIGVWLQSVPPSGGANTAPGGEITFGGLNPARYKGEITYIDNIPKQHWTIPVAGMKVGDTVINTNSAPATIDTGTTAMLMPKSVADAINRAIPGAEQGEDNLWYLPCSGNTPISITFGTFTINIPYTSLAIQQAVVETTTGNYCLSAAMFPTGSMAVIDQWLIGDAVLSNVYTVFDFDTNAANGGRIGFAQLNTTDKNSSGDEEANNGSFKGITSSIVLLQATAVVVMSALFAVL